jgi:hypothetical protein
MKYCVHIILRILESFRNALYVQNSKREMLKEYISKIFVNKLIKSSY